MARGGQPGAGKLGIDQLRELVCLLFDAPAGRQDHVVDRLLVPDQPPTEPIAYRVGFHNLGEEPASVGGGGTPIIWVDVADWDLTQRTAFYNALFGIAVTNFKTPSIDAMLRIGNLFETGGAAGVDCQGRIRCLAVPPTRSSTTAPAIR